MNRFTDRLARVAGVLLVVAGCAGADTLVTAVPPAANRVAPASDVDASAAFVLQPGVPTLRVDLPQPTATELQRVKSLNARADASKLRQAKSRALAVAFGRAVPASSSSIGLASLPWQTLPDGSRAARIEIASPGAAALRVALTLPASDPDLEVRFGGTAASAPGFGPVPANLIASDTVHFGKYWSPAVSGDVAVIEFHALADARVGNARLGVVGVSHQVVAPSALKEAAKTVTEIGQAGACNIDVKCQPQTTAFVNATKAVAEIEFTQDDGSSYLCTGQLLNDANQSNTPWFFTANHCINSAGTARSLITYWFFDAVACGSKAVPPYVQQNNGATLLARSEDFDWALIRLNAPPPAGATFSAWRAEPVAQGAAIEVMHHAEGDLKKWAGGAAQGYHAYSDGSSFIIAQYAQGTTEGGSSGAGLLTLNSAAGYYEVRGALFGGAASCDDLTGPDEYSRLDNMLPLTRDYLTPATGNGFVAVVEFYNANLAHYFMSSNPSEINDLDTGVHPGWERTGLRFLASATAAAGFSPVCRFYRSPAFGDSHFYSASPDECAQTAAAHPVDWIYESSNVFYIQLPDANTGACPGNTKPVWRFFNQVTTNHRYTADVFTRDEMRFDPATWVEEGYGPDQVIMCTPVGT